MHCVAGDGAGILAGAVLSRLLHFPDLTEIIVEYVLGFGFGWTVFQALFMRDMAGGSYPRSLKITFAPELLSMNFLMTGMLPTVMTLRKYVESATDPTTPSFWFVMSMGLLVGFVVSYPINWWLVANHLKHGMMTVRPASADARPLDHAAEAVMSGMSHERPHISQESLRTMPMSSGQKPWPPVLVMALLSFLAMAAGAAVGLLT
jgi:hypothetical protein